MQDRAISPQEAGQIHWISQYQELTEQELCPLDLMDAVGRITLWWMPVAARLQ